MSNSLLSLSESEQSVRSLKETQPEASKAQVEVRYRSFNIFAYGIFVFLNIYITSGKGNAL